MYAADVACEILGMLPDTDLVDELRELISTQYEILCAMADNHQIDSRNRHIDSEFIQEFLEHIDLLLATLENVKHGQSDE